MPPLEPDATPNEDAEPSHESPIGLGLSTIVDTLTGVPIPAPIKKGFFKAVARLMTAAVEVPATVLEGIVDEKKAVTASRVRLIKEAAGQISKQMTVSEEYAKLAAKKHGDTIVRERLNVDEAMKEAAKVLAQTKFEAADESAKAGDIEDDWLNQFEKQACLRSSDDMQKLFGRILAGEIRKPGSFSIRALKIMGEIDRETASLFTRLVSLSLSICEPEGAIADCRVISLGKNASTNGLAPYGLSFSSLNRLNEYGLVIADYNGWLNYGLFFSQLGQGVPIPIRFQQKDWMFATIAGASPANLTLHGVSLTRAGRELARIVLKDDVPEYASALREYLRGMGVEMVPAITV